MAEIVLDHLTKIYPGGERAVASLDLEIRDGELMVLVGPSGCGKTSVLRMVAGLEEITQGEVRIGGRVVNRVPPRDRDVAMVFQSYALYPHMTVFDNMAFGLRLRKLSREEIDRRVRGAARALGLESLLRRKPRALSGGQRQRVAMGRAMVREPKAFLMDEPLSNLDAKLRVRVRAEIARLQRDLGVTTLYVTHDQVEAMTLGDRVAVIRKGVLQQAGPPQRLYDRPANVFVAGFLGSPAMNLWAGELRREGGTLLARFGPHRLRVGERLLAGRTALRRYEGKKVLLGIRPGDLRDAALAPGAPADRRLPVTVDLLESLGRELLVHFTLEATAPVALPGDDGDATGPAERAASGPAVPGAEGDFLASLDPRAQAREGARMDLVVDADRLHFFDPDSGRGIYDDGGAGEDPPQASRGEADR